MISSKARSKMRERFISDYLASSRPLNPVEHVLSYIDDLVDGIVDAYERDTMDETTVALDAVDWDAA